MAVYGLVSEGVLGMFKKKSRNEKPQTPPNSTSNKITLNKDELQERNILVKQIDSVAKSIIEKYAKDKKMIKRLNDAILTDIPDDKDDTEFDRDYELKNTNIGFCYYMRDGLDFSPKNPSSMVIWILDEDIENLLHYYRYTCGHYYAEYTNISKIVKEVFGEIENRIDKEVKSDILSIGFKEGESDDDCYYLDIIFKPKKK